MRFARYALGAIVVASLLAGSAAFAAHLTTSSNKLGSGSSVVARCDSNSAAWTYGSYTTNGNGQITGFTIGHISTACEGGLLSVNTTDASNTNPSSSSPVSIPSGTGSCSTFCTQPVTVTPPEYPANLVKIHVVVTGP